MTIMTNVRAKFYVNSVTKNGYSADGKPKTSNMQVELSAVYAPKDDKSENHRFWENTPSGKVTLSVNSPACFEFFKEGEEFYVDFIPANPK
jgi:hypothetical protein